MPTVFQKSKTSQGYRPAGTNVKVAFDTVCHATLMEKMAKLQMPDQVFSWIKDFF